MQSETQAGYSEPTGNETPIKEKETKYSKSGVKKRALELYEKGKNPKEVFKILDSEGFEVSPEGIRKLLITNSKLRKTAMSDIQVSKKFKQMVMDYDQELKGIMEEIKEAREIARETKDLGAWSALLGRAFQGIELFSKIAGDYKESKIDVNILIGEVENRLRANKGLFEESIDIDSIIVEDDENVIRKKREDKYN